MARHIHHHHHTEQAPGLFGALALFGFFTLVIGPVLSIAAALAVGLGILIAYLAVCDLAGWAVVAAASRSLPRVAWPLTGGLFTIISKRRK